MRSQDGQRKQKAPEGACPQEEAVNPRGTAGGRSSSSAQSGPSPRDASCSNLMEQVVVRENMVLALKRVQQNKGAPGVDGMTVKELPEFLRENWPGIRQQLLEGTYKPAPVRRVEIPKPSGACGC